MTSRQCDNGEEMSEPPAPALPAAVPASSARAPAKRTRQSSPAKRSKHRTDEGEFVTELIEPPQAGCAESQAEDRLSSLPPELQAAILGNLDIKSIHSLYAAGYHGLQALAAGCHFSANSTLTAKSLTSSFFVSTSGYLRKLDLSGVPNLNLPTLLNALSRMKNLNNLDVSYTNVTMEDFLRIVEVRPTLKTIAINFALNIPKSDLLSQLGNFRPIRPMTDEMVMTYQQAFARFEDVHFVGDLHEPVLGALAGLLLEKANLFSLKYTVIHDSDNCWSYLSNLFYAKEVTLTQFQLYFHKALSYQIFYPQIYTRMDIKKYEILLFVVRSYNYPITQKSHNVYATPLLSKMICKQMGLQVSCLSESVSLSELRSKVSVGHKCHDLLSEELLDTAVFFWDKERTDFDSAFSSKLVAIFKEHFVFSVNGTSTSVDGKWYSVKQYQPLLDLSLSKQPDVELDYGPALQDIRDVKLKILFNDSFRSQTTLKLVNNCDFFKKLSHLCLCGNFSCDADFFKDVFAHCESLTTLELMTELFYDAASLRYLHQSKTLKNILISASGVDMCTLFAHLSECRTLENICLSFCEKLSCLPDPSDLFTQCANLYSMYIHLKITNELSVVTNQKREEMLHYYNSVMSALGRDALTLVISTERVVQYHTHLGVFKFFNSLVPIKS